MELFVPCFYVLKNFTGVCGGGNEKTLNPWKGRG